MAILGEYDYDTAFRRLSDFDPISGEGLNFNIYKHNSKSKPDSQGREHLHALIEKCWDTLRLMSYRHFMKFLQMFFAVKNLSSNIMNFKKWKTLRRLI